MKTIFNIDKVRICLLQPEGFFDELYRQVEESEDGCVFKDGFFLKGDKMHFNDKDITTSLYTIEQVPMKLGEFTFNRSQKYGSKCFFTYETKVLYEASSTSLMMKMEKVKYNYFSMPFYAFRQLELQFNNVSYIEIAADTNASVINKIQYAVSHPEQFEMVLLWKRVLDETEILDGYWEFFQRSRVRRATKPTIYIHSSKGTPGNRKELKIYDKVREMLQSRKDKETLVKAWNEMDDRIQRLEISLENKPFTDYFKKQCVAHPGRWVPEIYPENATKQERLDIFKAGLEHFFYDIGMNEQLRAEMFIYFSNQLLHFKYRNHSKTQLSLVDLCCNSLATIKNSR